jgi:phosphatidylglycerophosphatase A
MLPWAPGTWGSLAALPFAYLLQRWGGTATLVAATLAVIAIGAWAAQRYLLGSAEPDPGAVVIDEVAGQWLTLVVVPADPLLYAIGFVLFRIADILKPWPASWADSTMLGGIGIMLDDLLAAPYAAAGLALAAWLLGRY